MKAIVLAAGKGTRLVPLTGVLPKPMAPVADKPIIQHIFELLSRSGVEETQTDPLRAFGGQVAGEANDMKARSSIAKNEGVRVA